MTQSNCLHCSHKSALFKYLTKEELIRINDAKTQIHYLAGELINKQGTPVSHLISFTDGLAMNSITKDRRRIIVEYVTPGTFIGAMSLFSQSQFLFNLTAITDCCVCLIEKNVFVQILYENQRFNTLFMEDLSRNHQFLISRFTLLFTSNTFGRIAEAILYLEEKIIRSNPMVLPFPITDLADFCGLSRESIFKSIRKMTDEGIITTRGKEISILDRQRLALIARKG